MKLIRFGLTVVLGLVLIVALSVALCLIVVRRGTR
jgi:hypothetical protein